MHLSDHMKTTFDTVSVAAVLASLAAWLPPAAAAASLVWTLIRIWETKTVQQWRSNRSSNRRSNRSCKQCGKPQVPNTTITAPGEEF